jgi:signal transduction histidine kinase
MTIRKQWLVGLSLMALIAVIINTLIFSVLTGKLLDDYVSDAYVEHVNQLVRFSEHALKSNVYSEKQIDMELETHLTDPIIQIKLYTPEGILIGSARGSGLNMTRSTMWTRMMSRMMSNDIQEVDQVDVIENGEIIGFLNITRSSSLDASMTSILAKSRLFQNALIAMVIVLSLAFLLSTVLSKRMTKDIEATVALSKEIDLGEAVPIRVTRIKELRILQENLMGLHSKLKLKQKSRKQLIDEMVHQSRTPLTILKMYFEGFEDGVVTFNQDEIAICLRQIDLVTQLIDNVGNMIESEGTNETLKIVRFSVNALIEQITRGLSLQFEKKNISLSIESTSESIFIVSDIYKLSQVLYNLLTNACNYTPEGGHVHLEYAKINEDISICVSDDGMGISSEEQKKIFEAYYRCENVRDVPGEGIGLYIAKENIKQLRGNLKVRSKENEGATFIVILPENIEKVQEKGDRDENW